MGNLKIFSTLSPIPGFRRWLEKEARNDERPCDKAFQALFKIAELDPAIPDDLATFFTSGWRDDSQRLEALRAPLTRLCAHYLSATRSPGRSLDPVSRFHLTNGARIEHVNWMGDTSSKGLAQSLGFMVNYRYLPDEIEENHELYRAGDLVPMSNEVKGLLKP